MVIEDMMSNNVKFESPLHIGNLENNRELCIKPPRQSKGETTFGKNLFSRCQ